MLYQTELPEQMRAHARDRTKDLQIFSLTLSQLSYMGVHSAIYQDISVKLSLQLEKKKFAVTKNISLRAPAGN